MIQKLYVKFLLIILFVLFGNTSNAGYIPEERYNEDRIENYIIKYTTPKIEIDNILVKYDIGFQNEIPENELFIPIKLEFSEKINAVLEIYSKSKDKYEINYNKEVLYKKIEIEESNNLNTYFYKSYGNKFYFYLNINGKKILLQSIGNINFDNDLKILDYGIKINNIFGINEIKNIFFLKQFERIFLEKENLSNSELEILNNYIFGGGKVIVDKNLFNQYFVNNNHVKKIAYRKNCVEYGDCDYNGKETFLQEDKYFYELGFGNIFIKNYSRDYFYDKKIFLRINEVKSILIDDVIESKFVPFYIILIFVIIYFISLLIINFLLPLKYKKNKFFFFYSIPLVSIFFLISIIIISFIYRGFDDIENKVQVNLHLDNKVFKQVYIASFSVFGGDYDFKINKEDFEKQDYGYRYDRNYSKKEISFKNNKVSEKILGLNSLSILYKKYSKIEDENSLSTEDFSSLNSKSYNSKKDLLNDYSKLEKEFKGHYDYTGNNANFSREIDKVKIRNIETDFMKKYSYGGEKNKNIVIDVFYK